MTLETYVAERLASGDPYVLSPTGYVAANDPASPKAVVVASNKVSTDRMVVVLPVDSAWLKASHIRQLIAVIRRCVSIRSRWLWGPSRPLSMSGVHRGWSRFYESCLTYHCSVQSIISPA